LTLNELLPHLLVCRTILVTGPQRSGTTIGARVIAQERRFTYVDEEEIRVGDVALARQVLSREGVVLQAPGLCHLAHTLGVPVVVMRRRIEDIELSQQRIGWTCEHEELAKYGHFDQTRRGIAALKYHVWDSLQRHQCVSFDLDYISLAKHPLWVEAENRKTFAPRQWISNVRN
jgi:hypothetical protein